MLFLTSGSGINESRYIFPLGDFTRVDVELGVDFEYDNVTPPDYPLSSARQNAETSPINSTAIREFLCFTGKNSTPCVSIIRPRLQRLSCNSVSVSNLLITMNKPTRQ